MAHTVQSTENDLKSLSLNIPKINHFDLAERAYTIFAFASATLLIGLALRIIFALLFVGGPLSRGITIFTDPFVSPFNNIFKDSHTMVQMSTGATFSAYYLFYTLISYASHFVRSGVQEIDNQEDTAPATA
ncbi:MAG: hypothetical protein JWO47_838 [Candidatus Saccharibacteria bacterium]|nr:hypothetical protein [Candidatus Saccharibacteria bacterium]